MIESINQGVFVEYCNNSSFIAKIFSCVNLMIVTSFTQPASSRQDDKRLPEFQRRYNYSHSCVSDNHFGSRHSVTKFKRWHKLHIFNMTRQIFRVTYLGKDVSLAVMFGPLIDSPNESIKRHLRADRNEDHNIDPR